MGYNGLGIVENELKELDEFIYRNVGSPQALICEAVNDLAGAGGKRIRPALTILVGKALGYKSEKLIPIAASMEVIHMATLVHDDIVDDSWIRRGRPTVQSKYGKDVAVFTGDFLFSKAFLIISQYADKSSLKGFADAVKRICEGEIEQYENRFSLDVSILKYLRRIRRKTGVLLALSCIAGATRYLKNRRLLKALASYGMYLGLAFQITDDILDFTGNAKIIGKPVGNDIKQGVYTLPLIYALKHSGRNKELVALLEDNDMSDDNTEKVIQIVRESGGIEFSQSLADRYVEKGVKSISFLKSSIYKEALEDLIKGLNERDY